MNIRFGLKAVRLRTAMLITAALVGTLFMSTSPAQATTSDCKTGYICFWKDAAFTESGHPHSLGQLPLNGWPDLIAFSHPTCPKGTWNDCISSVYNSTGYTWCLYMDKAYSGKRHNLGPNDVYYDLSRLKDGSNDAISSMKPNHC